MSAALLATAMPARAQDAAAPMADMLSDISVEQLALLAAVLGVVAFATLASVMLVRARERLADVRRAAGSERRDLRARLDQAEALIRADAQALVIWPADGGRPTLHLAPASGGTVPAQQSDVLAFGRWLDAGSARDLEAAVAQLRDQGAGFDLALRGKTGGYVAAVGRAGGGQVSLRLRDVDTPQMESAHLRAENTDLKRIATDFAAISDGVDCPVWIVDDDSRIVYANAAYARALGREAAASLVGENDQLIPGAAPADDAAMGDLGIMTLPTAREVRRYRVQAFRAGRGTGYVARDVDELDEAQRALASLEAAHSHTLAQLKTGVAALDAARRLVFFNPAFLDLWQLDPAVLSDRPDFGEVLDQIRAAGRLPEVSRNYRDWREEVVFRNTTAEARDAQWHLPDGRTLRVIADPQPDGGLIYLFENVTESIDLQTRFVALSRVQRETIDSLLEGIVVFGSDGRLKLHNPTFQLHWVLDERALANRPHVDDVTTQCAVFHDDPDLWGRLRNAVTGLADARRPFKASIERQDGMAVDMSTVPLPDGGTLVIFADVTDSRRVERALRDSNDALLRAAQIKNDFVHKVSYELRSPLTNIIGFAQLLSDPGSGPLDARQREYTGYILSSSSALLAIINDILDLATIDAGVMELDIAEVDIRAVIAGAAEGLRDRLDEQGIRLVVDVADDVGPIEADEKRLRQVLFNLLSNAIGFSESGQSVTVAARATDDHIDVTVRDEGRGIAPERLKEVFERFQSDAGGTDHRGPGLGLNIARSLIELHGGSVDLTSEPGRGTEVCCRLPVAREPDALPGDPATADDTPPQALPVPASAAAPGADA